jgi:hypothetical protein
MSAEQPDRRDDAFSVVRRFARRQKAEEQCEICSRVLDANHQHLIEPAGKRLSCVCDACAVLFAGMNGKYRRVPKTMSALGDFRITDAQWDGLLIPIEMAFFYRSTMADRVVAIYPSPAGPTESLLPLETWEDIVRENPVLATLEPDVEALVVNRLGERRGLSSDRVRRAEYFILPIDECFRLVGLMRLHWKGLSGGADVWKAIAQFFDEVRVRATPRREAVRA